MTSSSAAAENSGHPAGIPGQTRANAKAQQSPLASKRDREGEAPPRLPSNLFPMGYKQAWSEWWNTPSLLEAERTCLSYIPAYQNPSMGAEAKPTLEWESRTEENATGYLDSPARNIESSLVPLSGKNRAINEITISPTKEEEDSQAEDFVMLHGYGAGLAFFYKNYASLSAQPGWRLHSLDLLGYGRSTRPPFAIQGKTREEKITAAETWFVDSLEEWRQARRIERFTLLGHSLGGYLATCYALRYPDRVKRLVLASPVGIPEDPYAITSEPGIEPEESALQEEFIATSENPTTADPETSSNSSASAAARIKQQPPPPPRRPMPKWLTVLWDMNISPFSIVRWGGPLGPKFVSGWTSRRFSFLPPTEAQAMHAYAYSLFRQRGSGEYALSYILAPGAYARSPLLWRVQGLKMPVLLMYGEKDWMDVRGGFAAMDKIRAAGGRANLEVVAEAGHHLYLDNSDEFNATMGRYMRVWRKETLAAAGRL